MTTEKPKILFDVDGTLALWNLAATEEEIHDPKYYLSQTPDIALINVARTLLNDPNIEVGVISKVFDERIAKVKVKWLNKFHLGGINHIFVPYEERKDAYIPSDGIYILIDDYTKNLNEWEAAGHTAIKYRTAVNGNNGTWKGPSINQRMSEQEMLKVIYKTIDNKIKGITPKEEKNYDD